MTIEKVTENQSKKKWTAIRPSRSELVLVFTATAVITGWIVRSIQAGTVNVLASPFAVLSVAAATLLLVCTLLKWLGIFTLSQKLEEKVVPAACGLPVLGFLIDGPVPLHVYLTVGGAFVLACYPLRHCWRQIYENVGSQTPRRTGKKGKATQSGKKQKKSSKEAVATT